MRSATNSLPSDVIVMILTIVNQSCDGISFSDLFYGISTLEEWTKVIVNVFLRPPSVRSE